MELAFSCLDAVLSQVVYLKREEMLVALGQKHVKNFDDLLLAGTVFCLSGSAELARLNVF